MPGQLHYYDQVCTLTSPEIVANRLLSQLFVDFLEFCIEDGAN